MWWTIIFVLVAIVACLVALRMRSGFQSEIPKIIWSYWDDPNVPLLTQKCMDNWKRMCPDYEVRLLNKTDVPAEYKHLTPERQSDWLRLDRIKNYGGVWLDASVFLTESLDWIQGSGEALMFYQKAMSNDASQRMYESWFIASVPNGKFITALFNEFDFACKTFGNDGDKYIEHLRTSYGHEQTEDILQNIYRGLIGYLTIYVCIQKVIKIDGLDSKLVTGIPGESGPILYQTKHRWNHEAVVKDLLGPWPAEGVNKLVKLVREDRKHIQKQNWLNPHPESIFAKFLI
jgi:Capsular polysaccharide synthesis protein